MIRRLLPFLATLVALVGLSGCSTVREGAGEAARRVTAAAGVEWKASRLSLYLDFPALFRSDEEWQNAQSYAEHAAEQEALTTIHPAK